jgi:tetratricopeptide (TPR) repeat protein
VNELDNYTSAIFVGEPTSENINFFGDTHRVELPNSKIPVFLSFAWWQDKPQWENQEWLAPDVAVEMTFDDYRHNRDPVLDAVFSVPTSGVITDPMGRLRELFETQKLDDVRREAQTMIQDPRYKFVDFERELNEAGYRLLRSGKMPESRAVFQLITELFPQSANAWDSFAEWHLKSDDHENATKYYQKAIELDPEGPTGQNARSMLKQMNRED